MTSQYEPANKRWILIQPSPMLCGGTGPFSTVCSAYVYGLAGDKAKALSTLADLTEMAKQRFVSPVDFAVVYAGLGDADRTFHWLDEAYQARSIRLQELPSPYFDKLRSDPRYRDLVRRVGLS